LACGEAEELFTYEIFSCWAPTGGEKFPQCGEKLKSLRKTVTASWSGEFRRSASGGLPLRKRDARPRTAVEVKADKRASNAEETVWLKKPAGDAHRANTNVKKWSLKTIKEWVRACRQ